MECLLVFALKVISMKYFNDTKKIPMHMHRDNF